jgi:hypothetical protein
MVRLELDRALKSVASGRVVAQQLKNGALVVIVIRVGRL